MKITTASDGRGYPIGIKISEEEAKEIIKYIKICIIMYPNGPPTEAIFDLYYGLKKLVD
jgi:hypothetical protein